MKELTENEIKVLGVLAGETDTWGEQCLPFSWIEEDTKFDRKTIRKACRVLREKGLVVYLRGLMTEDGEVAGSGYHISPEGRELAEKLGL